MSKTVTLFSATARVTEEDPLRPRGVVTGVLDGETSGGEPLVRWVGGPEHGKPARVIWMKDPPTWSECQGLRVLLTFEDGDPGHPIVLGLLDAPPAESETPKVLKIESEEELILECGQAKITLRADGKIVILGGYVVSQSTGVNRIRGGSVQIN
ncbi:MAG: hypothetical protein HZB55_17770 [Deltaproteobacteria bacterium]|nr:hypothetical protein [Deltaproteobacteria bacterium]